MDGEVGNTDRIHSIDEIIAVDSLGVMRTKLSKFPMMAINFSLALIEFDVTDQR